MNHHYNDIRSRIAEPPLWFDTNGVPRYEPFRPRLISNIYAFECCLAEIACQNCGHRFLVAFSWSRIEVGLDAQGVAWGKMHEPLTPEQATLLHYGDPPNVECCPSGPTMNCLDLRIVEWWRQNDHHEFQRVPSMEIPMADADVSGIPGSESWHDDPGTLGP